MIIEGGFAASDSHSSRFYSASVCPQRRAPWGRLEISDSHTTPRNLLTIIADGAIHFVDMMKAHGRPREAEQHPERLYPFRTNTGGMHILLRSASPPIFGEFRDLSDGLWVDRAFVATRYRKKKQQSKMRQRITGPT